MIRTTRLGRKTGGSGYDDGKKQEGLGARGMRPGMAAKQQGGPKRSGRLVSFFLYGGSEKRPFRLDENHGEGAFHRLLVLVAHLFLELPVLVFSNLFPSFLDHTAHTVPSSSKK